MQNCTVVVVVEAIQTVDCLTFVLPELRTGREGRRASVLCELEPGRGLTSLRRCIGQAQKLTSVSQRMVRNVSGCDSEDKVTQAEQTQGRGKTRQFHVLHSQVPGCFRKYYL